MLGWQSAGDAGKVIALLVVFFLSAGIAVLGHATMIWVQRIFAVLLVLTLAVVFSYTVGGVDWGAGPEGAAVDERRRRGDHYRRRRRRLRAALVPLQRVRLAALPAERDADAVDLLDGARERRRSSPPASASWA